MSPWNTAAEALWSELKGGNYAPDKQPEWLKYLLKHL